MAIRRKTLANKGKNANRAAIYARISLDKQDGAGVARQTSECQKLARERGLDVVRTYSDNSKSAYKGKLRPEFQRVLEDAQAGIFDVLIVWATDRLYRALTDLESLVTALEQAGIQIETVKSGDIDLSTADGRLHARLLGSVAAHESEKKAERISARAEQRKYVERKMTPSKRPFGWAWVTPDPKNPNRPAPLARTGLKPHDVEAPLLAECYEQLVEQGASVSSLARWLSDQGMTGTQGGELNQARLSLILRQGRHAGLIDEVDHQTGKRGQVIGESADGQRIVSRELWEKAQTILRDPSRKRKPGRPSVSLLGPFGYCGVCGGPVRSGSNGAKDRPRFLTYDCRKARHVSRTRDKVDSFIIEEVGVYLANHAADFTEAAKPLPMKSAALAEFEALQARLETLAALMSDGRLDPADYALVAKETRAKQEALNVPIQSANVSPKVKTLLTSKEVATAWHELAASDPVQAREVLKTIGLAVWVFPSSYTHDPNDGNELPPSKVSYTFDPIFVENLGDPGRLDPAKAKAVSGKLIKP